METDETNPKSVRLRTEFALKTMPFSVLCLSEIIKQAAFVISDYSSEASCSWWTECPIKYLILHFTQASPKRERNAPPATAQFNRPVR